MPLPIPNLDDRTFDDLVKEAKTMIPVYNQAWTNHNVSDPGITLIELFAWLTEATMYRVNQVTEANYRQFLALLGVERIFEWNYVPGPDNAKLVEFLSRDLGLTWAEIALIKKEPNRIIVTDQQNIIELQLSADHTTVTIVDNVQQLAKLSVTNDYWFDWERVPGQDEEKFNTFLINRNYSAWVKTASIKKKNPQTIRLERGTDWIEVERMATSPERVSITSSTATNPNLYDLRMLKVSQELSKDIRRALATISHRYRAVTTEDYEFLARECMERYYYYRMLPTGMTGRAICLNNRAFGNSGQLETRPGHVTVMLVPPDNGYEFSWNKIPSGTTSPNDTDNDTPKLRQFLRRVYGFDWIWEVNVENSGQLITLQNDSGEKISLLFASSQVMLEYDKDHSAFTLQVKGSDQQVDAYSTGNNQPTELLKNLVKQYLDHRRLLTTRVHVESVRFHNVEIEATVILKKNANEKQVHDKAVQTIQGYFDLLTGGPESKGWPVGRGFYRSELYTLLESIPGVDHVASIDKPTKDEISLQEGYLIRLMPEEPKIEVRW